MPFARARYAQRGMPGKARVLVVANRTAESPELLAALSERAGRSACEFTLLVPATPQGIAWAADMHAGEAGGRATPRGVPRRASMRGLDVQEAKVGDPDPLAAVQDECNFHEYDEIIVSTLPLTYPSGCASTCRARRARRRACR